MITFTLPIRTANPNNGATGNTKLAAIIKTRLRAQQRRAAWLRTMAALGKGTAPALPVIVTVTRVAPSKGLDPHDGLGAALKGLIDGIADGLGLKSDRDDRVEWRLAQRRGPAGVYAVEVTIQSKVPKHV